MNKLIIALLSLGLMSCAQESVELVDTTWELNSMNSKELDRSIVMNEDSFTLIIFKEGAELRLGGRGDGNSIMGVVELDAPNSEIEFENMASTRMMSKNQTLEDEYLKMLDEVDGYSIKGSELNLMDDDKIVATYLYKKKKN